jgi:hypothetical protein
LKKPSPFNSWKSRPHPTQSKKPSPSDPVEKAVPIRSSRKSRSHPIQSKKSFSFNFVEKALKSFICVDHPAALTTQLRWSSD